MVILVDARAKRNVARALLAEGRDPMVMKKLKIEANLEAGRNTFERVARQWHEMAKPQWAAIHASDVLRSLERDIFPEIGEIPIADLTPPIIYDVLKEIEDRGAVETAKRRSEARRVGHECVSPCRSRWSTYHKKKKEIHMNKTL